MGVDPATATIIAGLIGAGGSVAKSIFAPQGQFLSSFEGSGELDPRNTLAEAKHAIEGVFGGAAARASQPVDMSDAYVQDLPSFTGGALPMPIGVTGSWGGNKSPAAATPSGSSSSPFSFSPSGNYTPPSNPFSFVQNPGLESGIGGTGNGFPDDPTKTEAGAGGPAARSADPSSLFSGLDDVTGPVRKTPVLPGASDTTTAPMQAQGQGQPSSQGQTDPSAIGAVSLLLHLAKPGTFGADHGVTS